jgi:drug/metabolite transporter (DMT)-like permease
MTLRLVHVGAALVGFIGAELAVAGGRSISGAFAWGCLPALGSALIWASHSLLSQETPSK